MSRWLSKTGDGGRMMDMGGVAGLLGRAMVRRLPLAVLALGLAGSSPVRAADTYRYYGTDAIGSVRVVTDQAGALVERHDYLPFGEECSTGPCASNPGLGAGQPKKFTGKERDQETGLDYFGARYYGSKIGRFTTVDPYLDQAAALVNPQQWNRYAYVRNNPLKFVDPDGRDAVWVGHADGTATLVIPVNFSGADATDANVAAITSRANGLTVLDPNVSIQVIATDKAIKGKLNRLDFSPGLDVKMCGAVGECVNERGGNKAHINSANGDAIDAAAHDIFHFAGIRDRYKEGAPDEQGRRTSQPQPGFTNRNIMTSRGGTELTGAQVQEAKGNRSTKGCSGEGGQCR